VPIHVIYAAVQTALTAQGLPMESAESLL